MGKGQALSNTSPSIAFFGITIACVIISQAFAYLTSSSGEWPGEIALCAILCIAIQWIVFIPSALFATGSFFDIAGSGSFFIVSSYSLFAGGTYHVRQMFVTLFTLIWSVRLGSFLYQRVQRAGKDSRFDEIKHNLPRFFNMWTIQGLFSFLTALPVFVLNSIEEDQEFPQWNDYLGMVLACVGFAFEVIADNQKTAFKLDPANDGKWIETGLWSLSRHPNYFGEICIWVGIFCICSSVLSDWQWLCIESPIFVAFLLTKVSGIPLLEARAQHTWGNNPDYMSYVSETPVLIPIPSFGKIQRMAQEAAGQSGNGPAVQVSGDGLSESLLEAGAEQPVVESVPEGVAQA